MEQDPQRTIAALRQRIADLERMLVGGSPPFFPRPPFAVPESLQPVLTEALAALKQHFKSFFVRPGAMGVGQDRFVVLSTRALSHDFLEAVQALYPERSGTEAREIGRDLLLYLARILGRTDARCVLGGMQIEDPLLRLAVGPLYFACNGWGEVELLPESHIEPGDDYVLHYSHPHSFEADVWLAANRGPAPGPVCVMNAGYSSGWCAESLGQELTAVEVTCRAAGDDTCRFIMAPPGRIDEHLSAFHEHRGGRQRSPDQCAPRFLDLDRVKRLHDALMQTQKMEAIGTLAGGVAHDLNNILAVILGLATTQQLRLGRQHEAHHDLEAIAEACRKGRTLTSSLLGMAQPGPGAREPLSLDALAREVTDLLGPTLGRGIAVRLELNGGQGQVEGDAAQVQNLLINLCLNAAHAMGQQGTLTLRTRQVELSADDLRDRPQLSPGPYLRLEVIDTGSGMAPETAARAFEAFFTTKGRTAGTGLGLAMVRSAVASHGGRVWLDSAEGRGTRAVVELPLLRRTGQGAGELPQSGQVSPPTGSGTVLLVDDEPMMRSSARRMLETLGYDVLAAESGAHALQLYQRHGHAVSAVLLDMAMPELDGTETLRRLLTLDPAVQVVLTSGFDLLDERHPVQRQAVGSLQKPYDIEQLADTLARCATR